MRNSIILPNYLDSLFTYEAEKSGLIKPFYNPANELYDGHNFEAAEKAYSLFLDNRTKDKQNLFRILLLFDDIILPNATQNYDYDKLIKTGMFSVFFLEDALLSDPIHQDGQIEYAKHLKRAIVPVFEKNIRSYFRYGQAVDGFSDFVSDLYDCILLDKRIPTKHNDFIEQNKAHFDIRNHQHFIELKTKFGNQV